MLTTSSNLFSATTRALLSNEAQLRKTLARISSGSKLAGPEDDPASYSSGLRIDSELRKIDATTSSVNGALSFTQTQDGYLEKLSTAITRMSELSVLSQDATRTDADRKSYASEYRELAAFVGSNFQKDFNGRPLFSTKSTQVNSQTEMGNGLVMQGIDLAKNYGELVTSDISTAAGAVAAQKITVAALQQIGSDRASVGAYRARLNLTLDQLSVQKENATAALAKIRDIDMAQEATEFSRLQILTQSGTAILAQANTLRQAALRLLQ